MSASSESLAYLVLDIETAVDGRLVAGIQFPGEDLTAEEATARYAQQRLEATGSDFIPHTYQVPVGIVVAKVAADFRLVDLVVLDEPQYRSHVMTRDLWRGWEAYRRPTLVTFNGRTFDLPVLEMAAFRYGISVPAWFAADGPSYDKPRYRYNQRSHLDLMDLLTNFGASRFPGGLDLAARILGKPGKIDVCGQMVQELYEHGRLGEISDYCRCDVLDTYFVFLRSRVLVGELDIDTEQQIVAETRKWLETQSATSPGLAKYLENWGDWSDPWTVVPATD